MKTRFLRPVLVVALVAVWLAGMTIAAERSASNMATAANRFLAALSPEQRQQASFALDSEELAQPAKFLETIALQILVAHDDQASLERVLHPGVDVVVPFAGEKSFAVLHDAGEIHRSRVERVEVMEV